MQHTGDVSQKCTPETCIISLTDVTSTHVIQCLNKYFPCCVYSVSGLCHTLGTMCCRNANTMAR